MRAASIHALIAVGAKRSRPHSKKNGSSFASPESEPNSSSAARYLNPASFSFFAHSSFTSRPSSDIAVSQYLLACLRAVAERADQAPGPIAHRIPRFAAAVKAPEPHHDEIL